MRLSSGEASVPAGSASLVCVGRAKEGNAVTTALSHVLTARLHSWSSGRDKALSGPLLPSLVPLLAGCFEVHKENKTPQFVILKNDYSKWKNWSLGKYWSIFSGHHRSHRHRSHSKSPER